MLLKKEQGSVILLALFVSIFLSVLLVSVITLVGNEIQLVERNQNRTAAFYLAEAGIEYARMHLDEKNAWDELTKEDWEEIVSEEDWEEVDWEEKLVSIEWEYLENITEEIKVLRKGEPGNYTLLSQAENNRQPRTIEVDLIWDQVGVGNSDSDSIEGLDTDDFLTKFGGKNNKIADDIKNVTLEDDTIELSRGSNLTGAKHEFENLTFISTEGEIDFDFTGSEQTFKNIKIEAAGDVDINLGNKSTMECVVVYVDTDKYDVTMTSQGGGPGGKTDFEAGKDYFINPDLDDLDCAKGESYIIRGGSWRER